MKLIVLFSFILPAYVFGQSDEEAGGGKTAIPTYKIPEQKQEGDFKIQVKNCEKTPCRIVSSTEEKTIYDINGVLFYVPTKLGKYDKLSGNSNYYNGVLPDKSAAGFVSFCKLDPEARTLRRQDVKDCDSPLNPDNPCMVKKVIKEFENLGLKLAVKIEIPLVTVEAKKADGFRFGNLVDWTKTEDQSISIHLLSQCYYQYKKP